MNESQSKPPDAELIAAMGRQKEDLEGAKAAFCIFFDRHCDYLVNHLKRINSRLVGYGFDIEDVVQEVFDRLWLKGHRSFNAQKRANGASSTASTRAWLTTITLRVAKNWIRDGRLASPTDPADNEDLFAEPTAELRVSNAIAIQRIVETSLKKIDAEIVWFKMRFYDPETRDSRPDREELAAFLAEHNLTDAAFRQRYSRAMKTLASVQAASNLITR